LQFLLGSSVEVLPKVLADLDEPALFWLDGHWTAGASAGPTAGEDSQCPVLEELQTVDAYPFAERSCILVDDARLFLGPPPPPYRREDFPPFLRILDLLRERFDRYVTVLDDVIIAGPQELQAVVEEYWLGVLARHEDQYTRLAEALNPRAGVAASRLARAVLPPSWRKAIGAVRARAGNARGPKVLSA
jgi:hypothetical protein